MKSGRPSAVSTEGKQSLGNGKAPAWPRRPILMALALSVLAGSAGAAVLHVGPGQPFASMEAANAAIRPGDVAYLHPAAFTTWPNPAAAATGGLRFTYIGAPAAGDAILDTLARATITVPGGNWSKPYVTVKGVRVIGSPSLTESADRCSLIAITASGSWSNQGADYTVYDRSSFKGPWWNLNKSVLGASDGVGIYNCDFPYLGQGQTGVHDHIKLTWDADSTVEQGNRYLITVEAGLDGSLGAEWHFGDRNHVSRGNETRIRLNRDCYAVWRWRSNSGWGDDRGCYNNRLTNDRIYVTGPGGGVLMPSSSANCGAGAYMAQCVGAWDTAIDSCVIDASGTALASSFYFQGGTHGFRITRSVLAMNGTALRAFDVHGSSVGQSTLVGNNVVTWTDEYDRDLWDGVSFTGNVVAAWSGTSTTYAAALPASGLVSNLNLYKGTNGIPRLGQNDQASAFGDPRFVNGTKGSLDAHLTAGSPAIGLVAGGDAGAFAFAVTPPAGGAGQPCRPDGSCDAGLECVGGVCRPIVIPPPADTVRVVVRVPSLPAIITVTK